MLCKRHDVCRGAQRRDGTTVGVVNDFLPIVDACRMVEQLVLWHSD